jgi:crotonobetainyl-CoA:carnitine CoA-transferase CaiB-like acyl-CoA transferase
VSELDAALQVTRASGRREDRRMPGALDELRVLDLSWGIAGALGTLLLAEQGADVVKVEPPGGDPFRDYSGFAVWNRSRRSVTIDLKRPEGVEAFHRLADGADVLVETFRPGVMERLGIGYDALHARNRRLVYASCPAYPEGHRLAVRPGYDALVQASSGQQWEQPGWRLGPIFLHVPLPSMAAMFLVPTGILAALVAREETGRGQHVRTSLFQGSLLFTTQIWTYIERSRSDFFGTMVKSYPPGVHQEMVFEVADDEWVHTSIMSGLPPVKSQDEIVGVPGASDPSRYPMLSAEERARITPLRRERYKARQRDALITEFRENNHAVEAIDTMEAALGARGAPHEQLVANEMVATVEDPVLGKTTQVGVPIHLLGTPGAIRGPRPLPGEHSTEILGELGFTTDEIRRIAGETGP